MNYQIMSTTTVIEPLTTNGKLLRLQVADRLTIDVQEVKLTEYRYGDRMVWVHGHHVRLDGQRGAHNRCYGWKLTDPMPQPIAQIVEHAKPDWGPITHA